MADIHDELGDTGTVIAAAHSDFSSARPPLTEIVTDYRVSGLFRVATGPIAPTFGV